MKFRKHSAADLQAQRAGGESLFVKPGGTVLHLLAGIQQKWEWWEVGSSFTVRQRRFLPSK